VLFFNWSSHNIPEPALSIGLTGTIIEFCLKSEALEAEEILLELS